jgi:hypothetical protein
MKISKKTIFILVSSGLSLFILCIVIFFVIFIIYYSHRKNQVYGDDLAYYDLIKSIALKKDEITLNNIFIFNWNKAYIVNGPELSGDDLDEILGVDCNLLPLDNTSHVLRIVFIYNNKFVHDFAYDSTFIQFLPNNEYFYKDTVFAVSHKWLEPIVLKIG